jgi:hypothetical protein
MRTEIQDRKLRKVLRIVGVLTSVAILLLVVVVAIALLSLPSMSDLQGRYFATRLRKPVSAVPPITMQVRPLAVTTTSSSTRSVRDETVRPTPTATPAAPAPTSLADYAVERFVERGDRSLRVCENLVAAPVVAPPVDLGSFSRSVQNQIATNQTNAFAEAALAPLGALLQLPSVGSVARELRDAQDTGDLSIIRQAQFYSNVAFAAADVYRNKALLDTVSQHAYHLSVMARLARVAPSAQNQPEFLDLCTSAESAALNPASSTLESIDQEKASLLNLIGSLGMAPQQVGFDPALDTRLSINITPQAVTVLSPWMDSMYRSGLQLSAQAPQ